MYFLIEKFGLFNGWLLTAAAIFIRYALFAGLAYLLFYIIKRKAFSKARIQRTYPGKPNILSEIRHSFYTAFVFALIGVGLYFLREAGYTRIYTDISTFGWIYLLFSFLLLVFLHDTYFYWVHRLMHHRKLFRIFHRVHHLSHNPTPWASLSFHPLEAVAEIAVIPLAAFVIPLHPLALFLLAAWSLVWNVIGHLGYELFPAGFVHHPVFQGFNTSTHHNMHHQRSGCNYGLYFNFWDTWMGTNHPEYRQAFDEIKRREQAYDF